MYQPLSRLARARTCAVALCVLVGAPALAQTAWQPVGPWGGPAEVVRTLPDARDGVVAATRSGALFLSQDGGGSWREVPFPARASGVLHALEVDPRSGTTWYVGMEGSSARTSGVYRTTDGGRTWALLPGMKGIGVWSLAFAPSRPDVLAAGADAGIYLSRDGGTTWTLISPPGDPELRPVVSLAFDPRDSQVLYAGTTHLPWRTGDGGATWQPIHSGMLDDSDVFSMAVDPTRPDRVLASACSGAYGSRDAGRRWTRFATPRGAFRVYLIALDPRRPETLFAATSAGLLKSANDGVTWQRVSARAVKSIAFDRFVPGRIFFASTDGGLLVSTDGGSTVRESNTGFGNRNFTSLTGSGTSLYLSGPSGFGRTDDSARRWTEAGTPGPLLAVAAVPDRLRVLVGAGSRGLFASADGGLSWQPRQGPPGGARVKALLARPAGGLLAGTDQGLFREETAGGWRRVSPTPVDWMQASGTRGMAAGSAGAALVSDDGGATWRTCAVPVAGAAWYGVALAEGHPALALAATSRGVFRSEDGCQTWAVVTAGLEQATAAAVVSHPTRTGEAFVSQGGRVWRSTDAWRSWRPLDEGGRADLWPSSLLVLASAPDQLFALVPGRGVLGVTGLGPP